MVNRAPSVTKSTQSIVSATSSERRRAAEKLLSGFDVSVADRGEAVIKRHRDECPAEPQRRCRSQRSGQPPACRVKARKSVSQLVI